MQSFNSRSSRRRAWFGRTARAACIAGLIVALVAARQRRLDTARVEVTPTANEEQAEPSGVDRGAVTLCQALGPAAPCCVPGVDCANGRCGELGWDAMGPVGFQQYAQGEYVGRARLEHVPVYRLRVDDEMEFVFRLTREETLHPYELNVGDEIRLESFNDQMAVAAGTPTKLDRNLVVQPDGTITLPLLGQVRASHHTVAQLRDELEDLYKKFYKLPAITITPIKVNTKLEDVRATVDSRAGFGGQSRRARVTPEGTIALPVVGSVPAQGLTLQELKHELDERYATVVEGIEVTPVLVTRAPRHVFVVGEVRTPGRFTLDGPTTVMQSIAMAGSWNVGANIRQVVVFRRGEDWRLVATMLDLRDALLGRLPCPPGEIWVSDADLIIVPKSKILLFDNLVDLTFTKGLYGIVPLNGVISFTNISALAR